MPSAPSAPAELPEKVREAIEKIAAQMNGRLLPSFIRQLAIDIALLAVRETALECSRIPKMQIKDWSPREDAKWVALEMARTSERAILSRYGLDKEQQE